MIFIAMMLTRAYYQTFDVVTSDTPINQAYSDDALILHMDLGFYEAMPGLQLLHCVQQVLKLEYIVYNKI